MGTTDPLDRIRRALAQSGSESSDFDLNPEYRHEKRPLRAAGVLVPLIERPQGLSVLLTKRASGLKHHPGQIAFPGGKVEETDTDVTGAALREAQEEVGLDPALVTVLGAMPIHETVTGFAVTPILGHISARFSPIVETGEVDEAFFVPLDHLLRPENYSVQQRLWLGTWRSFYTVPWGPYYIWGATARMLHALAVRVE
ncbi:CoA pyrophosphatase [Pararhodobacter sp.]|uniref:CoA pyrophosphatase n=1 Tax=Pararhodobacter sp. TaxID=2127056 RepID=UPI002AFEDA37|nr:CoA pyrophosphatase [Pararhodobacter sp.]